MPSRQEPASATREKTSFPRDALDPNRSTRVILTRLRFLPTQSEHPSNPA
jgi:hypothetical protein